METRMKELKAAASQNEDAIEDMLVCRVFTMEALRSSHLLNLALRVGHGSHT